MLKVTCSISGVAATIQREQCRAVRVQRSHFTCMTCSATNPTVKLSYLGVCNRRKLRVITEKENRPSLLCFVLSRNSKFVNKLVKVFKVLHLVSSLCNSKGCFFTEITANQWHIFHVCFQRMNFLDFHVFKHHTWQKQQRQKRLSNKCSEVLNLFLLHLMEQWFLPWNTVAEAPAERIRL